MFVQFETEDVEKLETFAVAFGVGRDFRTATDFLDSYKIKLHGQSEIDSPFQSLRIKVSLHVGLTRIRQLLFATTKCL